MSRRSSRHRRQSPITSALRRTPARFAVSAAALTLASAGLLAANWPASLNAAGQAPAFSALGANVQQGGKLRERSTAARLASPAASPAGSSVSATQLPSVPRTTHATAGPAAASPSPSSAAASPPAGASSPSPVASQPTPQPQTSSASGYRNPFRDVSGLIPERIDQGVDFGGAGPVYALGDAVITNATSGNYGWPGGGWITYQLTDGPAAGLMVFLAEDVRPAVQVGQHVTSSTVIAHMFNGGDGIETGWAQASGLSSESQLPEAGGISGNGPFPTKVGTNFERMLQSLGVPASFNSTWSAYGLLPSGYPRSW